MSRFFGDVGRLLSRHVTLHWPDHGRLLEVASSIRPAHGLNFCQYRGQGEQLNVGSYMRAAG